MMTRRHGLVVVLLLGVCSALLLVWSASGRLGSVGPSAVFGQRFMGNLAPRLLRRFLQQKLQPSEPDTYDVNNVIRDFLATPGGADSNFFIAPRDRMDIGRMLEAMQMTTGVELGVQAGNFALHNLRSWPRCQKYYLVDVWAKLGNYKDFADVDNAAQNALYAETRSKVAEFGDRVVILRNLTVDALHLVPGTVDFVFVDARHDYCAAKEDINMWWHKVRPGGILAGHDYRSAREVWPAQDWSLCSDGSHNKGAVMGAVNEFAMIHGLHVTVTYSPDEWRAWLIRKPLHHQKSGLVSESRSVLKAKP